MLKQVQHVFARIVVSMSLFACATLGVPTQAIASAMEGYTQLVQYLNEEKSNLALSLQEESSWVVPEDSAATDSARVRIQQQITMTDAEIQGLERLLNNQYAREHELSLEQKKLQDASYTDVGETRLQTRLNELDASRVNNTKLIELIEENLKWVKRYQTLLGQHANAIAFSTLEKNTQAQRARLQTQIMQLEQQRASLYTQGYAVARLKKAALHRQTLDLASEHGLIYINQMIALLDDEISTLQGEMNRNAATLNYQQHKEVSTLETLIGVIEQSYAEDQRILNAWSGFKLSSCAALNPIEIKDLCQQFHGKLLSLQKKSEITQRQLAIELQERQNLLRKQLASRQSLMDFSGSTWIESARQIAQIPLQSIAVINTLLENVLEQYSWQDRVQNLLFIVSQLGVLTLGYLLYRGLARMTQEKSRSRLSGHLFDGLLMLLYRNVFALTAITLLVVTVLFNQVPYAHYRLLMHLGCVWFATRQLILIARLTLLERVMDAGGHDVKLYYRLKWLLLMGGWSTAMMIFSHELPLSFLLQDIFDRVFMLFILAVSLVIWQSRDAVYYVFPSILTSKKPHVRHVVFLLNLLIPLTLLTTALLGLVGYINLAWTMSRYEVYFLVFITGYVLLRGVIRDGLDLVCEWMVSSLHNGWLWVEAILKPLDQLIRFFLLFAFVLIFLHWVGLLTDPRFIAAMESLAHYPLINFAGVFITLISLAEFIALLLIFVWATKWSREFCYRWLYARVTDPGVRNSFSVFTQYAVVVLGCIVTLRVLGIDFTGMMVVLGGLAVGMGFGLRDFASNIVGGIMLLIERPVREGDLITIGEHEGRVAHIGIRSMRVSSWDNMEVLVPNAETFNKPFTNWTHQDSVVRTVVPIKVSRTDNPVFIQSLIHGVLADIPEIMTEPPPQVYLKNIDEALLEFEVRYFINVQLHTRFEIRSKALLAIMRQFKAAGIEPPIPPIAVELKQASDEA